MAARCKYRAALFVSRSELPFLFIAWVGTDESRSVQGPRVTGTCSRLCAIYQEVLAVSIYKS